MNDFSSSAPVASYHTDFPRFSTGTILCDVRARVDGTIFTCRGQGAELSLQLRDDQLIYTSSAPRQTARLELEDVSPFADDTWHSLAVTVAADGTRIYVDGYLEFCGTTTVFLADFLSPAGITLGDEGIEVRGFAVLPEVLTSKQLLARTVKPEPLIRFAADHLSAYDVKQVGALSQGTIFASFRVRGRGQQGTILAAASGQQEKLRLAITAEGIRYEVWGRYGQWRTFFAPGSWTEGDWHDVAVRVGAGAVEIYVDGFRELHAPGQAFFADLEHCDQITVGQDCAGVRLLGEVRFGQIYPQVLGDHQLKRLSHVEDLPTVALFDRGYHGSLSYRIPSLLALPSGTVIAGADQRVAISNDSPNEINFVVRRSLDDGRTWQDMQTVLDLPGKGLDGASVSDSVLIYDEEIGRVVVLIDQFPGAIGFPNAVSGRGVDEAGNLLLQDSEGNTFTLFSDGSVRDEAGKETCYRVAANGDVSVCEADEVRPGGNIYLKAGLDPHETLLQQRTSYILALHSDDEAQTWSRPRHINGTVKEDWMPFLGTSPGTGLQLKHGPRRGRLVAPCYFNNAHPVGFSAAVLYSDDHGETWQRGQSVNEGRTWQGEEIDIRNFSCAELGLCESTLHERRDGTLVIYMRNQHPSGRVAVATSRDGGETWGDVHYHDQLPEIFSQPNVVALPSGEGSDEDRLVFANASQLLPYRGAGVLRYSADGGRSFRGRTFRPFHYVYQCMTLLGDGSIGLLWENECQGLYFTRIPQNWFDTSPKR